GPKGDRLFILLASILSTSIEAPVNAITNKSIINPGFIPVPNIVTSFSLAILSNSFDNSGSCALGYAISSAVDITFIFCSKQYLTLSKESLTKESVHIITKSATPSIITSSKEPAIISFLFPLSIPVNSYILLPILGPLTTAPDISTPFLSSNISAIPFPIDPKPQITTLIFSDFIYLPPNFIL